MPGRGDKGKRRGGAAGEDDIITQRLIEEGDRSPRAISEAALEAFDADQRADPESPTRIRRRLAEASGVEDPSHSRGTQGGRPTIANPRTRGARHANRDLSDMKGSSRRAAEQTGERESGRSAANPPAAGRNTRSKQTGA